MHSLVYDAPMWKDIIGHEGQIARLKSCIRAGRIPHAFLFCGPEGLGKTKVAHEFFKAINCLESPSDPCDACRNCIKADSGSHPDLVMIEAEEGLIQVKDVRTVIGDIGLKPFEARSRVVVIEPAEHMNKASSNAILKTLEEPPAGTVIVLVSHKPTMLLPTIVSRCQIIRFTPADAAACRGMAVDPVLLRLTSGSIGAVSCLGQDDILQVRDEMIKIATGGDPFDLISQYFSGAHPSKELAAIVVTLAESMIRDILVLVHHGDNLINEELKDLPLNDIRTADIDDLSCCLRGIRQGMNENINLKNAMSELLIMLGSLATPGS